MSTLHTGWEYTWCESGGKQPLPKYRCLGVLTRPLVAQCACDVSRNRNNSPGIFVTGPSHEILFSRDRVLWGLSNKDTGQQVVRRRQYTFTSACRSKSSGDVGRSIPSLTNFKSDQMSTAESQISKNGRSNVWSTNVGCRRLNHRQQILPIGSPRLTKKHFFVRTQQL